MISVDGDRSRKRLPVANKALAVITDLDLPAKAGIHEGFIYKVWQHDKGDLSGGRITSPAGIFVLCSVAAVADGYSAPPTTPPTPAAPKLSKIHQLVCDSYETGAAPIYSSAKKGGRHIQAPADTPTGGAEAVVEGGKTAVRTIVVIPQGQRPLCVPSVGDHLVVALVTSVENYGDVASAQVTHCYSSGRNDVGSPGVTEFLYALGDAVIAPLRIAPGSFEYLSWVSNVCRPFAAFKDFIVATRRSVSASVNVSQRLTGKEVYKAAPAQYWDLTAKTEYLYDPRPLNIGTYASYIAAVAGTAGAAPTPPEPPKVRGIVALYTAFSYVPDHSGNITPPNPLVATAETAKYIVTLSFFDMPDEASVVTTVDFSVLEAKLHALIKDELTFIPNFTQTGGGKVYKLGEPADGRIAGTQCAGALGHILGGPAEGWYTAGHYTTTFSDAKGVVYSWGRLTDPAAAQAYMDAEYPGRAKNGGFKFVPVTGFERLKLVMPAPVLAEQDYAPELTMLTDAVYLCLARDRGVIKGVFVGSPFSEWRAVPMPKGTELVAVRPTIPAATAALFQCLAVGHDTAGGYYVYSFRGGAWSRMSPVPPGIEADLAAGIALNTKGGVSETEAKSRAEYSAKWDLCSFGSSDAYQMFNIKQFPVAR